MKRIKAAIFSENARLFRFLELELTALGCEVVSGEEQTEPHIAFVDVDTVSLGAISLGCPMIGIGNEKRREARCLSWPFKIEWIKERLEEALFDGEMLSSSGDGSGAITRCSLSENAIIIGERRIRLSKTERLILEILCEAKGKTVKRERLMSAIDADGGNICDVYICRIRKKLEEPLGRRLIFTDRGVGYRCALMLENE